jgi:predicted DNA-binding protein with PD1-like motif
VTTARFPSPAPFTAALVAVLCVVCARTTDVATAGPAAAQTKFYGGAQIQEIYRLSLERDDLILESINQAIHEHSILDGAVLTTVGATQECSYHYVKNTAIQAEDIVVHQKGAAEILNANGIIANGESHIHITLATPEKGAFGGHLENGCKVAYVSEITIAKFSGPPLTRTANKNGLTILGPKKEEK